MGLCHMGWVGSLTVKPWTYGSCVSGCIRAKKAMGWALDPRLAFNTLPAAPNFSGLMNLNTFIVCFVLGCEFLRGDLLQVKNVHFAVEADVCCVTVLPTRQHTLLLVAHTNEHQ